MRIPESGDRVIGSSGDLKSTGSFREVEANLTLLRLPELRETATEASLGFRSPDDPITRSPDSMTHSRLVDAAVSWLRSKYHCGIVLSEQSCASGETPDAIGWKGKNHSVVVECKISRADFLADAGKPWRMSPESALGCERFYLAPAQMISHDELPCGWGLLELRGREVHVARKSKKNLRGAEGLANEMNLLLASLRRVEVRIEPQTITDFLKWKNRMARYNGGALPVGISSEHEEANLYRTADLVQTVSS
jgi:hypothetical protein